MMTPLMTFSFDMKLRTQETKLSKVPRLLSLIYSFCPSLSEKGGASLVKTQITRDNTKDKCTEVYTHSPPSAFCFLFVFFFRLLGYLQMIGFSCSIDDMLLRNEIEDQRNQTLQNAATAGVQATASFSGITNLAKKKKKKKPDDDDERDGDQGTMILDLKEEYQGMDRLAARSKRPPPFRAHHQQSSSSSSSSSSSASQQAAANDNMDLVDDDHDDTEKKEVLIRIRHALQKKLIFKENAIALDNVMKGVLKDYTSKVINLCLPNGLVCCLRACADGRMTKFFFLQSNRPSS